MHLANQSSGKLDKLSQGSSKLDKLSQSSMGDTLDIREAHRLQTTRGTEPELKEQKRQPSEENPVDPEKQSRGEH